MSEYQYVGFRAVDGPVSEENLAFMEKQSSRAEITPWSFDNEYHFGDFRGNAGEMLRRGYDFHLHYANYGIRNLMIRLPSGLPDAKACASYLVKDGLSFVKDKQGLGGILRIEPYIEPGELDDLWNPAPVLDRLLPLRAEILSGDLRPLYLGYLAVAMDGNHDPDEQQDAPVPAGLDKLTEPQRALAEFYGLDDFLIAAAAEVSPSLTKRNDPTTRYTAWLRKQPAAKKTAWLAQLMADPGNSVRRDVLAEFQKRQPVQSWPTVQKNRTIAQLRAAADAIHETKRGRTPKRP
jgi:hypothetical protein